MEQIRVHLSDTECNLCFNCKLGGRIGTGDACQKRCREMKSGKFTMLFDAIWLGFGQGRQLSAFLSVREALEAESGAVIRWLSFRPNQERVEERLRESKLLSTKPKVEATWPRLVEMYLSSNDSQRLLRASGGFLTTTPTITRHFAERQLFLQQQQQQQQQQGFPLVGPPVQPGRFLADPPAHLQSQVFPIQGCSQLVMLQQMRVNRLEATESLERLHRHEDQLRALTPQERFLHPIFSEIKNEHLVLKALLDATTRICDECAMTPP